MEEYVFHGSSLAGSFIEDEDREIQFTGLYAPNGDKIIKVPIPKPKFGFPIFPEDNDGYDFDTDTAFFYGRTQ